MSRFVRNKKLIITLIGIILFLVILGVSIRGRSESAWYQDVTRDVVGTFQRVFTVPIGWMDSTVSSISNVREIYEENRELKQHLTKYAEVSVEADDLRRENEELRQMVEAGESSLRDFDLIPAEVIGRTPNDWQRYVTINVGQERGVEKGMAVTAAGGMVGRVIQTSAYTSQVQLLSDNNRTNNVSAVVKDADGKAAYGTIDGFDSETNELFFTKVSNSVKLKEGEIVSTSGLGGRYPAGLVIGKVKSIETDEYGVSQVARITPEADFNEFSQMFVIDRTLDEPFLTGPEEGGAAGE
ncbi:MULTISPECIES: rod shape-determining protein MreC [Exiguobacterium]|uniref:rod shape-determining protein MreC n=1 Tax=Exiguobacterium TaxID=33986 RepID=UPI0008777D5E|nr:MULTISPECIES: rod shape-determining protein MreC [Exiguobacterium]OGX78136.1 rod shape-determining protein MreC [Exiguobacterium sp. SH31]TCI45904.1 rod shape-determining protein MreC [Exiguobacterium sp. SH5S32]TCI51661.1 rod shape-determining protein MreC [Exiguobacterium sp. SH1S4]TCI53701.1 rod shape-determining protein MreC [Exiguobacterium sp. SH1S21]TCI65679.1 rod shape-determining protein MreC [Exiguobacterium sp. SH0S2]